MAFDEEWAQLKHDAAMRIDHVDPGPIYGGTDGYGKGTEDYTVNYDDLGKVGHDAYLLFNAMEPDGKYARHSSETAGSDLKADGFETGRALTSRARRIEEWCAVHDCFPALPSVPMRSRDMPRPAVAPGNRAN